MDQGGVDSLLIGLSNDLRFSAIEITEQEMVQTFINRLCGLDRAGLTSQDNKWSILGVELDKVKIKTYNSDAN